MGCPPACMQLAPVPPSGPSGWVTVVGGLFCAPYPLDLTMTRTKGFKAGNYTVTDVNGNIQFKVKRKSTVSFRDRPVLYDANGNVILSMQKKAMSMHGRWNVFRGDTFNHADLLFSVKKSSLLQFKTELDVFLASNSTESTCDFRIKGSLQEKSCVIYLSDSATAIARMTREDSLKNKILGKDGFEVTIYPNVDHAFVCALIVILEEIVAQKQQQHDKHMVKNEFVKIKLPTF